LDDGDSIRVVNQKQGVEGIFDPQLRVILRSCNKANQRGFGWVADGVEFVNCRVENIRAFSVHEKPIAFSFVKRTFVSEVGE
jgi:hypothetical protein